MWGGGSQPWHLAEEDAQNDASVWELQERSEREEGRRQETEELGAEVE